MIKRAILWGAKGDRIYEYYYIYNVLMVKQLYCEWPNNWIWITSNSCYRTIEAAISDKNDRKRVLLKHVEE